MQKPLPPHDKHTAHLEISKSGFKFICVLVAEKRHPVRLYGSKRECLQFAADHGLDFVLVGGAA